MTTLSNTYTLPSLYNIFLFFLMFLPVKLNIYLKKHSTFFMFTKVLVCLNEHIIFRKRDSNIVVVVVIFFRKYMKNIFKTVSLLCFL